jgi:hypothetical protein
MGASKAWVLHFYAGLLVFSRLKVGITVVFVPRGGSRPEALGRMKRAPSTTKYQPTISPRGSHEVKLARPLVDYPVSFVILSRRFFVLGRGAEPGV